MNRRQIFLLIMLLLTVLMFYDGFKLSSIIKFEVNENKRTGFNLEFHGMETSKEDSLIIDASEIFVLELVNQAGDVEIIGEERDNIQMDYQIIVNHLQEEDATDYMEQLELINQIDNKSQLKIALKEPRKGFPGILSTKTNYQIRVPKNIDLDVQADYGKMELRNINGDVCAKFRNAASDSIVTNLTGDADLAWSYSTAQIRNIVGRLELNSAYSQLTVTDVTDKMELDGAYSGIHLKNLGNDLEFEAKYGSLNIFNVGGDLLGEADYAGLNCSNIAGIIRLQSNYGKVNLNEVVNQVDITILHAPLELKLAPSEAGYQLDLDVKRAQVNSDLELEAQELANSHTRYTGTYQAGEFPINVKSEYGTVSVHI